MGYIAYAAGTLIAVALVHSFVTKKTAKENGKIHIPVAPFDKSVAKHELDLQEEENIDPVVTIEISHDGDEQTQKGQSTSQDATAKATRDTTPAQEKTSTPQLPTTNGNIPKPSPSQLMPPPPKLTTPSTPASQARQPPSSMPPPSLMPPRLKPATISSLAPPQRGPPGRPTNTNTLTPPPSSSSSLRVPAQKVLTNTRMQPHSQSVASTSTLSPSKRPSRKVILSPGHSPLDWASLTNSPSPTAPLTLRGPDATEKLGSFRLGRITPSQLKVQNGRKGRDAWTVYQGRVYNMGAYLDFHPGGREELLKGAGRGSDKLFAEVHPWVNWEGMLSGCLVGLLVMEGEGDGDGKEDGRLDGEGENELDEMD